jgi:hypothetical protein
MTHPLLDISADLRADQLLYRTLDFFAVTDMVEQRRLMFSRVDTFLDRNEGVDRLLTQLAQSRPGHGGEMRWSDPGSARKRHELVKKSHFVSCWTQQEESVAMWSLYSPDCSGVRIATSVGKLAGALQTFLDKRSPARLNDKHLGKRVALATSGKITPVDYRSLAALSERVTRKVRALQRLGERYGRQGRALPDIDHLDPRFLEREAQRNRELPAPCTLKDISFEHEREVRLIVRLGEEICTEELLQNAAALDPGHARHAEFKRSLQRLGEVATLAMPPYDFAACGEDLIESVALDPRCPPHKSDFMRRWFEQRGIRVVESKCFGYLPDEFSFYADT